jgi:hypothetical protein
MANATIVAAAASTSDIAMVVHLQCAPVVPRSNASSHIIDCQSVKMQCAAVGRDAPAARKGSALVEMSTGGVSKICPVRGDLQLTNPQ